MLNVYCCGDEWVLSVFVINYIIMGLLYKVLIKICNDRYINVECFLCMYVIIFYKYRILVVNINCIFCVIMFWLKYLIIVLWIKKYYWLKYVLYNYFGIYMWIKEEIIN